MMIAALRPNFKVSGSVTAVRLYWLCNGAFLLLFVASVALTLFELEESYRVYARLGFPAWSVFFNAIGKILGIAAILYNRSRTLKDFAYAGFLFDLLLALCAHIVLQEADVLLAIIGLVLWVGAFVMDRVVYRPADAIP